MQEQSDRPSATPVRPTEELYEFLENEIGHQLSRKQEIFAWASNLLVAIIGGIVALTSFHKVALTLAHKMVLTGAVLTLGGFSSYWIDIHWGVMIRARKLLSFYYDQIAGKGKDEPWGRDYTSIIAISVLTLMALLAVWVNVPPGAP
jgi:hypothetical protein